MAMQMEHGAAMRPMSARWPQGRERIIGRHTGSGQLEYFVGRGNWSLNPAYARRYAPKRATQAAVAVGGAVMRIWQDGDYNDSWRS